MQTLIIPDVHEQMDKLLRIEQQLAKQADRVIMLGDFFDTFKADKRVEEAATWIVQHIYNPKYTILWGNHDASYAFGGSWRCSGWTPESNDIIGSIIRAEDWRRLKVYAEVGDFLISHAGFHPATIHLKDRDVEALAIEAALSGQWSPMWQAGYSRGGRAARGGPVWLDFKEEFEPMAQAQIVGHTHGRAVRTAIWTRNIPSGAVGDMALHLPVTSYCIDTGLRHCVWTDGNRVEIVGI